MRWQGRRESDNVEDVRGSDGGGRPGVSFGGRGLGLGTVAIAVVVGWFLGINPMTVLSLLGGGGAIEAPIGGQRDQGSQDDQAPASSARPPAGDEQTRFVRTVLADTEDVWREQFRQLGARYREPRLVLFQNSYPTACGRGEAATGPFYCPADQKVYIDLGFYDVLRDRLGAPGDFAQAYVIAHEIGHHVQNLMGTSAKVESMRGRVGQAQYNALSVRLELQADCYAGVWAHHTERAHRIIETGDIEEALNAASRIGDDALQRHAGGQVRPESFTHGTSRQRMTWFKRGMDTGDIRQCDTFARGAGA